MIETESTGATAKVIEETTEQTAETTEQTTETAEIEVAEEITYHAVEKDGEITAIWEMQGKKHLRTIHPRSAEGKKIMALFETAA
ncbi:MAG: hypothetical protein D6735_07490 [Acidobacteria bacterium]|nr:MAG: hypothetical protein D6735_07490 [Acidobacteriota bacterium]